MKKLVPHFRRRELYSEWGRSPVGEVGDNNSHVRGRRLVLHSPNPPSTLSERLRTRRALRASVFEQDILLLARQKSAEGRPSRFLVCLVCFEGRSVGGTKPRYFSVRQGRAASPTAHVQRSPRVKIFDFRLGQKSTLRARGRGSNAVSRKIARDGVPHVLSRNGTLNRLIRMRCAKAPPGRTRGVLVVHKRSARRG